MQKPWTLSSTFFHCSLRENYHSNKSQTKTIHSFSFQIFTLRVIESKLFLTREHVWVFNQLLRSTCLCAHGYACNSIQIWFVYSFIYFWFLNVIKEINSFLIRIIERNSALNILARNFNRVPKRYIEAVLSILSSIMLFTAVSDVFFYSKRMIMTFEYLRVRSGKYYVWQCGFSIVPGFVHFSYVLLQACNRFID